MNTEKSAISSSWNANRVRSGLLNGLSSVQDTRPLLQGFLKLKSHILVIRQLAAGEQAKLLEIIDQVSVIVNNHLQFEADNASVSTLVLPNTDYHE